MFGSVHDERWRRGGGDECIVINRGVDFAKLVKYIFRANHSPAFGGTKSAGFDQIERDLKVNFSAFSGKCCLDSDFSEFLAK